jgi:tRNA(Ile)-lysidine synthase
MPRKSANPILDAIRAAGFLRPGDRVGVAVSGGADSVALLLLLLELRKELGVVLSVAHFNHKLRGAASDADEKFVAKLAAKYGLAFHVARADVAGKAKYEKRNVEDAARRARYEFFARLMVAGHVDKVAVAHTADDQAETVLAHILRGTGLTGLGGIHPVAGHVVRPLLKSRRAELRAYLRSRKQSWREDATNLDTSKTRARIRKKLVPLLEKEFQPAVVSHLSTLADLTREDEALLNWAVGAVYQRVVQKTQGSLRVAVSDLLDLTKTESTTADTQKYSESGRAMSARLVRRIADELKPRAGQLSAVHVDAVLNLVKHGRNGSLLQLPGGMDVRREHDALVFCARPASGHPGSAIYAKEFRYEIEALRSLAEICVPELGCVFRLRVIDWPAKRGDTKNIESVLDRDALRFPLVLRNWRPGDKFRPVGHHRAHKLKRLLTEKRISRWEREGWPVLLSGESFVWTRGLPVAVDFAPGSATRVGIEITEEVISVQGSMQQGSSFPVNRTR